MLRDKGSHQEHCTSLELDTTGEVSKNTGINCDSTLNDLKYFHACDGTLLPDVLHDVLEGALPYEVKVMLQVFMKEYFSSDELNSRLDNFNFGYVESKEKPTPIAAKILKSEGSSIKQTGIKPHTYSFILDQMYMLPSYLVKLMEFDKMNVLTNAETE